MHRIEDLLVRLNGALNFYKTAISHIREGSTLCNLNSLRHCFCGIRSQYRFLCWNDCLSVCPTLSICLSLYLSLSLSLPLSLFVFLSPSLSLSPSLVAIIIMVMMAIRYACLKKVHAFQYFAVILMS